MSLTELGIALMILMGLAVLANIIVIVRFFKKKMYTKFFNNAYLNLAISDLLMAGYGLAVRGLGKNI